MCATTMKIGPTSDLRTRQPVGQQRSDLGLRVQSTLSLDSVDCTIVTPLQFSLRNSINQDRLSLSRSERRAFVSARPVVWGNIGPEQRITNQWADTPREEGSCQFVMF